MRIFNDTEVDFFHKYVLIYDQDFDVLSHAFELCVPQVSEYD